MRIKDLFGFDKAKEEFVLCEKEAGEPSFGMGFPDAKRKREDRIPVPPSVKEAREILSGIFNTDINKDVILRSFSAGGRAPGLIAYMNGMADDAKINDFILKPLMEYDGARFDIGSIEANAVRIAEVSRSRSMNEAASSVMDGTTAIFLEGWNEALIAETRGYEKRAVGAPENEKVVSGPKEAFTESLRTNLTLIRRQLHTDDLVAETRTLGTAGTRIALIYREGVTNEALVREIKRRLARIDTGGALSSGTIAQMIEDSKRSPLPQILSTERPDRVCSHVLQGRAALLTEGSPFALVMPVTFFSLMNSPEDVYLRRPLGTLIRLVRYFGAGASVLLPGYFLALALYHQGLLSTEVLSTVVASRRMVFEPIGVEMLLLLLIFQMIREAGQRVPGNIGQAIGIIGGLIMGQAAVAAHLASSVVLIIVAASGLGNFCIPDYQTQLAASYFRIAVLIAAWLGGLLGVTSAVLFAVCHAAGLKSFGVPFLAPAAPKTAKKRPAVLRGSIGMHLRPDDYANTAIDGMITEDGE